MNLPRSWARLPGPVDFLGTVLDDLADRISVLAGLPDETLCDTLAVEVADLVKHRGLGRWGVVRSTEARTRRPSDSMDRRVNGGNPAGPILWIDATGGGAAATAWADYARDSVERPSIPRLCIAMDVADAEACGEDKRLRRRLWQDFVTPLDARAIVERFGRRSGHRPANIALRSALVAELADTDLALAERLSRSPLREILLKASDHPRERVWAAQVAVLFPIVERQRQRLLKRHEALWRVPHTRPDGTQIRRRRDLEIGDMAAQARSRGLLGVDHAHLDWLRRVRNQLAHNEVVSWGTLTSPVAVRIADFRE